MSRKQLPYAVGTWFAVPIPSGGYGVGVVVRANKRGIALGYFFGPRRSSVPAFDEIRNLLPRDAILIQMFGALGLISGAWHIVGSDLNWSREDWPMPGFFHRDCVSGKAHLRYYDEDTLGEVREEPCDPSVGNVAPKDGLAGQGALEIYLERALSG